MEVCKPDGASNTREGEAKVIMQGRWVHSLAISHDYN